MKCICVGFFKYKSILLFINTYILYNVGFELMLGAEERKHSPQKKWLCIFYMYIKTKGYIIHV